jgi:ribosomal protein L9
MEDIKSFGTFSAEVKVYNGVNATVYVSVGEE